MDIGPVVEGDEFGRIERPEDPDEARRHREAHRIAETDIQFLARMMVAIREGGQISGVDARKMSHLANFGPGPQPTTMPEERGSANHPLTPEGAKDLVEG